MDSNPELILASRSPRRRELLCQMGVKFNIIDVDIDESARAGEGPRDYVTRLALEKMRAGRALTDSKIPVLGADTVVLVDHHVMGKPQSPEDAVQTLLTLSGRTHEVVSAVAVGGEITESASVAVTRVTFRPMTERECRAYVATGEPMDKAGSYAIQGFAGIFVEKLEGSYSNVVGLPLFETAALLERAQVSIWNSVVEP